MWIKVHPGTQAGVPDRLLLHRGHYVLVELKGLGGKVSKAQRAFHEELRARGGWVEVCRSVAEVRAILQGIDTGSTRA